MEIINKKIEDLKPYENNPRFNDDAVQYVANSIKEFGFKVPMVIDKNNVIVTGHTRYKAALELGLKEVPCVIADDLTDEQIKAFRLVDNKASEFADWNFDLLDLELDDISLDMTDFGFLNNLSELGVENEEGGDIDVDYDEYSTKAERPQYSITGENTTIDELIKTEKYNELIEKIEKSGVTDKQKDFLIKAATRHLVFDYAKIAEYYANQNKEMQELMEESALVILDINNAIKDGYVELSKDIEKLMKETGIDTFKE